MPTVRSTRPATRTTMPWEAEYNIGCVPWPSEHLSRTNYNFNSASLVLRIALASRPIQPTSPGPRSPWIGVDASYSKLHLDTLSGIAYFLNSSLVNDQSRYISNLHVGNIGLRVSAGRESISSAGMSARRTAGATSRLLADWDFRPTP